MGRRLRLLWVTPLLPRRGVGAAAERFWQLLARLAPRHDVTLITVVDREDPPAAEVLPPGLAQIECVLRTAAVPDDPLAVLPLVVRYWYTLPALRTAVGAWLGRVAFDCVQYEFIELAPLVIPGATPSLLTVHQLGFATAWSLWSAAGQQWASLPRAAYEYLRLLDFELRGVTRAHQVITLSPEDAARVRHFHPDLRVAVNPLGVDLDYFRPMRAPTAAPCDLLFLGHFGHPPNIDAAQFLVREVVPRLGAPARVHIVGRGVTPEVAALAVPGRIEIVGAVPDQRPHLAAATVVVAPVRFGTGMRGKVLEALAMGRPVVTTPLGAEGLGARDETHLLVANDAPGLARAIDRLRADPALAARLGAGGRKLATRFGWDAIAEGHERIYEEVLRDPGRPPAATPGPGALLRYIGSLGAPARVAAGVTLLAARALGWSWRTRPW